MKNVHLNTEFKFNFKFEIVSMDLPEDFFFDTDFNLLSNNKNDNITTNELKSLHYFDIQSQDEDGKKDISPNQNENEKKDVEPISPIISSSQLLHESESDESDESDYDSCSLLETENQNKIDIHFF